LVVDIGLQEEKIGVLKKRGELKSWKKKGHSPIEKP
jgi:hypothetical protein